MSYCYERIFSAATRDEFRVTLAYAERRHCHTNLFLGARCYRSAVGPPQAKGRGSRWFDEVQNPDQLWLPFERYTPVKIYGVYNHHHAEYGDGWIIAYENYRGQNRELVYHDNQTEGVDRMIAISLYLRVEVRQRQGDPAFTPFPLDPGRFQTPRPSPRSLTSSLASVLPISGPFSELLAGDHVRFSLEREVSDMDEVQQFLSLDPRTGVFYTEDGNAMAHVFRCTRDQYNGVLNFGLALHACPENAYSINVGENVAASREGVRNDANERIW